MFQKCVTCIRFSIAWITVFCNSVTHMSTGIVFQQFSLVYHRCVGNSLFPIDVQLFYCFPEFHFLI